LTIHIWPIHLLLQTAGSIWRAGNTSGTVVAKGWNIKIDLISRWGLPPLLD